MPDRTVIAGVGMAIVIPTVVDALTIFYGVVTATLFVPVAASLLTTRGGQPEGLVAMGMGLAAWAAVAFGVPGARLAGVPAPACGLVASTLGFLATLALRGRR